MGDRPGRRGVSAAMEAESREWLVRCPACGHTCSIWDLGGIRYKARGTKWIFRRCADCRQVGMHLVYRERDGVNLPSLRPARPLWWYIVGLVAIVVLLIGFFVGGLLLFLNRVSAGPRDATTGYFAAVVARDWAGAHGRLSTARRAEVSPEGLATIWATREAVHGPAEEFDITRFSTRNGRTRVSGTLRYRDGSSEAWTVELVEENRAWVLASDP